METEGRRLLCTWSNEDRTRTGSSGIHCSGFCNWRGIDASAVYGCFFNVRLSLRAILQTLQIEQEGTEERKETPEEGEEASEEGEKAQGEGGEEASKKEEGGGGGCFCWWRGEEEEEKASPPRGLNHIYDSLGACMY